MTTFGGGVSGYSIIDPSAIPPPGMSGTHNWAGININEKTMLQMDAVFTSLRIISNGVEALGDGMAYTQALADDNWPYRKWVSSQPTLLSNTFGDKFQYVGMQETVWSMGLWGEAWWYIIERDQLQYPQAIDILNPGLLEIKAGSDGTITYWYGAGSSRRQLDPQNLIHIPHKSLPGAHRGLSSMDYAGVSAAIALAAQEYGARWFSQGMSPGYILSTDKKLGQDEVERIGQSLMIQHAGLSQAHLPLIMDSGIKPEKSQATPDEAQYLQTLEYARSVVASYFGIPASLLGNALQRLSPSPAHTVQEESIRMMQWTLSGYITPLEQVLSSLLPGKTRVAFDRTQLLQADAQSEAMLILNLRQTNVMSINEMRTRYLNLPPVDGGDELIAPLASNVAPSQTDPPAPAAEPEQEEGE